MELNTNFTQVPNVLIRYAHRLGINEKELPLILVVQSFDYGNGLPYPSDGTVAKFLGVSVRTVQRRSITLQDKELLIRAKGGRKPYWDFRPLYEQISNLEIEMGINDDIADYDLFNPDISDGVNDDKIRNPDKPDTQHRQIDHLTPTSLTYNPDNSCHPNNTINKNNNTNEERNYCSTEDFKKMKKKYGF